MTTPTAAVSARSVAPADVAEPAPPSRRRKAVRVVVAVALLAAVGVGLGFWRYAVTYAPLTSGSFGGPYGHSGRNVAIRTTDLGTELYVRGPAGTVGTVFTDLDNNGSHGVTVQRLLDSSHMVSGLRWSPYVVRNGGNVDGENLPLRPLPAYIAPHSRIRVVLTLRKPRCEPGGFVNTYGVLLDWEAMGVHHEYAMPIINPGVGDSVFVGCPHYIFRQRR